MFAAEGLVKGVADPDKRAPERVRASGLHKGIQVVRPAPGKA